MNIEAFFKISYGLYLVCAKDGERLNGHISNSFFQVTSEPPRFAICTNKDNLTTQFIEKSKAFAVSILQQDVDMHFIGQFGFKSGKDTDKFKDINYKLGQTGSPIVMDKTIAYIDCKVIESFDVGTHLLIIGEAVDADVINADHKPLTYSYYREIIKGLSPKNSPTYIDKSKHKAVKAEEKVLSKYQCQACGYIYEPAKGDAPLGIRQGTAFEDLPADWTCPICGAEKDMFEKL
jgi:flavin reductase (DIM6/NTAB) family NADH-FMN oxidoreductase RutF/rubredoxin